MNDRRALLSCRDAKYCMSLTLFVCGIQIYKYDLGGCTNGRWLQACCTAVLRNMGLIVVRQSDQHRAEDNAYTGQALQMSQGASGYTHTQAVHLCTTRWLVLLKLVIRACSQYILRVNYQ